MRRSRHLAKDLIDLKCTVLQTLDTYLCMTRLFRVYYLSQRRAVKVQTSLCINGPAHEILALLAYSQMIRKDTHANVCSKS